MKPRTDLPKDGELARMREELALQERRIALQEGLPHLYGYKWYPWARAFYESTNRINLLTAANQVSKSSTQIRKCLHWATETELWPSLWKQKPTQFWYFYPTAQLATKEYETKWKQFLPKNEFKNHPKYGWKEMYKNKEIFAIYFNSGINLYFQSYAQDIMALQAGTLDVIFCDEELPITYFDELMFRLSASDGYFHMVFTATLGQEYWRLTMEPGPREEEKLPEAFKQTVSIFECQQYEDGTPSHWTDEKIKAIIARCTTHNEVLKRVHGRFVKDQKGRKYPTFDVKKHMKAAHPLPSTWLVYEGVDPGSGGTQSHPSAICFVAVRPDFRKGKVFIGWRGDGIVTSAGDVFNKHLDLKREHKLHTTAQFYDWAAKDFSIIASRNGEAFTPAEKSHEKGEEIINTLFKYDMIEIFDTDELHKLASELANLMKDTPKNKAKDDIADAFRYAVTLIPWDFTFITENPIEAMAEAMRPPLTPLQEEIHERRKMMDESHDEESQTIEEEFEDWNEFYGN